MADIIQSFPSAGDECQPLTPEQMEEIKSQFHPSNTTNVNIVPYHIYDEDEHTVGEWRETIDGVKKKKPVYERKLTGTSPSKSGAVGISIGNNISNCFIENGYIIDVDNYSTPFGYGPQGYNVDIVVKQNGSQLYFNLGSQMLNKPYVCILRYTKTTDEWTAI